MEAATLQFAREATQAPAADASMDIDMDLDLGSPPEPEKEPIQTVSFHPGLTPTISYPDAHSTFQDPDTHVEGVIDLEAVYEKVHIRGVDELTTDGIKQFAHDHFEREQPVRIEWIDDTSANIIYSSTDTGLQALAAFTQVREEEDASALPHLRLRSAKLLSTHPDSVLQVRSAVKTDRKKPRAYEASRFYLMHPEHDPRERLQRELNERRRHEDDTSDGDYRRRRFDDSELRRRRDRDGENQFDVNMYDDHHGSAGGYSDSDRGRAGRRRRDRRELFPGDEDRTAGRLRNRSASPGRDTLLDSSMVDRAVHDNRRRFRERSPKLSRRNEGRELFPSAGDSGTRELFPNKPTSSYIQKDLFPTKPTNHRRSDAFDAADETADLLGRRISVPLVDGSTEHGKRNRNARGAATEDQGFAIRGAANGMSIKGRGASVRELFPSKYNNNADKDLFSDTLEGRGGRRRRAEDMFG